MNVLRLSLLKTTRVSQSRGGARDRKGMDRGNLTGQEEIQILEAEQMAEGTCRRALRCRTRYGPGPLSMLRSGQRKTRSRRKPEPRKREKQRKWLGENCRGGSGATLQQQEERSVKPLLRMRRAVVCSAVDVTMETRVHV